MPQRMTTKSITRQEYDVDCQYDCADANSKSVREPQRLPDVVGWNQNKQEAEVKKVGTNILHDERKRTLAPIAFTWLADSAFGRISPERLVVGAAIIITCDPESAWRPKNE